MSGGGEYGGKSSLDSLQVTTKTNLLAELRWQKLVLAIVTYTSSQRGAKQFFIRTMFHVFISYEYMNT